MTTVTHMKAADGAIYSINPAGITAVSRLTEPHTISSKSKDLSLLEMGSANTFAF